VLSNLGAVEKSSSLTRFMTAKDDNVQKQLAWGVMTDANGVMKITLRDFRPHVSVLYDIGHQDLANLLAQDYREASLRLECTNVFDEPATVIWSLKFSKLWNNCS